jgi:hypothetical protein
MPTLSEILRDPNYINANEATKRAIFERHAPLDQNYTGANEATQFAIRQRFGVEGFGAPVAPPPVEKQSAFRQIADVPLGIAKGAVQGVRMIADAFGAGSDTSKTIKSAETYLADLMSAQAKNDQQEIARIMKDAEDKGVLDQVKAGIKAFTVAPVDTLSSALGTAAPVIAGALGAKILGAGALVTTGVSALTGAGMGAGTIKGSIYEETKKALKEAGASEQDAEARAQLAQQYNGKNLDQILVGTVLGGAAALGPLEKGGAAILARRILGKTGAEGTETVATEAAKGAVRRRLEAGALEAVPEAVQAGQEQVATNIALQREGFDVPTFRGAVSSATLEGLAGAGLGAAVGGGKPAAAPEVPPPEAPPAPPPPALEYKPEPFIQFPDGTVAKRSEVEAYIKTLPEDQQMAMRAKLLGLAPQEAEAPPAEPTKALEFKPEPLIVYPDGSVARSGEVETYIQSLPENEQVAARAKLLGMGEVATQVTPEILKNLGIRSRAPIIQRLSGLELTDPKVTEELTNFAAQPYASPEVRGNIFGFLNTIKPVEAPAPVAPAAETPVTPTVETPVAEAPPTILSTPAAPVAETPPVEEPIAPKPAALAVTPPVEPVVEAAAPAPTLVAPAAPALAAEAVAPKAEAPPILDTSGIKEVKGRHPQVQAAAKLLQDKKMSREEFEKYVDYYKPIQEVESEKLLPPTSEQRMNETVNADKRDRINVPVADGTKVGLRMDLPARERGGSVVSIHEGKPGKMTVGKLMGFRSTGWLKDVTFEVRSQEKGLAVAAGAAKAPQQTVEGTWFNLGPEETYARVKELMKNPAWKQIGFDPSRHGYFYDRKTTQPVVSASEMYQVGQFLLAKDVEYAPKENFLYSIEPTIKSDRLPSYKRGVENLRKRWDKGEITAEEFANRVDMLARQIESAEYQKEFGNQFKGRERGADFIRQRLLEAKRRGELSDEAVDFAEWFILRNPALVDDLGISIRTPKEEGVGGMYSEMARVMYLMKERGNDQTIVHEILHHLERMMPKDVQTAIRKNWIKSLMEAQKTAKSDAEKTFFSNLTDYHFANGPRAKLDAAIEAIKNGDVEPSFYQYTSPSEFWAVNGSEIMQGRFDAKGALLQRLRRWLSELKEKARDLFGLNSTAPIIRALDSLSKGDGKFVSKTLLDDVRETRQVIEREGAGKEAGEAKSLRDRATANFRRWFGDSKVVDEKGEPLVVYHGTKVDFSEFSREFFGSGMSGAARNGFFFTSDPVEASDYASGSAPGGQVMPLYLSIQKPFELKFADHKIDDIIEADEKIAEYLRKSQGIVSKMRGVDGLILRNIGGQKGKDLYVAFRPEQIKSAIGNNGDYSLTNTDIRKSIGGRNPGEQAISIVNSLGMGVKPPEPGRAEKAMKILKDAGENPSLTKESAKKTLTKWLDWFETTVFSSDSAFNNKIRRGIISDFKQNPEVLGMLLEASQSQTVHADALASQFMIDGGLQYNDDLKKWESVKKDDNFVALAKKIEDLATKYNVTKDEMERIAHTYFVAKRLPGIIKRNEELDAEIKAERATAKPDRKQIEEWELLKVKVTQEQIDMVEPGLSLVKTIPELKEVVDIWQGIRKNNIEVMVNSGLWSPEYATAMWDNMDYVPYYREEQLEEGAGPQEFIRGLQVKSKEFKLKGSGAAVNDVFDNMIRWSQYAMNRAIRAHKATQMIDAALKIEVDGKPMATKVTEQKRGMNIVRVFRDGKQELYDMADPLFVNAFASIPNVSIPIVTLMSKVSNVLRQSVVLYPLFSVAQVPQDSFAAMFSSGLKTQHALKIPYLAVKEFIKTLSKTSATHNELTKYGVVGVRDFSATIIRNDAEIYAGLKPPKGGWGKTKEFLEHIAMAADNAVRQAVYEASMQQGLNKSEALEKAFEIINFRRRGTSKALNVMGQTIPFFYAYLSAQRVAYRVLSGVGISPTERKEAWTTLATTSAAVAALSMLYAMAVGDDEDYAETPAAIRDRTLTIPGSGGVRIPLRPDFFLFPKIVAEHTYLMLSDKGYEDGAKFRKSMADALISAIASPTPFPTAIKPAIEVAINYDFFQGKPLIGNFEKQKDIERQFRDSTSELAKILSNVPLSYSLEKGKFEGLSPIAIDHMIRGMLGSFGGLLLFGTNQFLHSDPDVPRPELSAKEMLAALPGTSGLLKRPQESALKNDFYQLRDEVEKAVNTFNDIKTRSPEGIEAFLEDEKNMARLMLGKPVDKINRELSKIRKVMTQITNMPESQMSGDEKSENIRQLRELEREILRSVNVKELREMAKI